MIFSQKYINQQKDKDNGILTEITYFHPKERHDIIS